MPEPRGGRRSASERGYSRAWAVARADYLAQPEHWHCEECQRLGLVTVAEVVDHKVPHRGDQTLFWDQSNWRPLCRMHHNRKTGGGA